MIWKYGLVGWVFVLAWWAVKWTVKLTWRYWVAWPWWLEKWRLENQPDDPLVWTTVDTCGVIYGLGLIVTVVLLVFSRGPVALSIAGFLLIPLASPVVLGLFQLGRLALRGLWWILKPPAGMFVWWRER